MLVRIVAAGQITSADLTYFRILTRMASSTTDTRTGGKGEEGRETNRGGGRDQTRTGVGYVKRK